MKLRGYLWIVPAMAAMWWFICLVGLLALWAKDHHNHFSGTATVDGVKKVKFTDVVYISDIGAEHQHYFIGFCVLTAVFYMFTVLIERALRHERHIPGSLHIRTSWFDSVSLFCAVAGSFGLIFLSIFNTFAHGTIHWSMTALFIVGALLSVLFQTIMLFDLSKSHGHVAAAARQLLWPAIAKCCIFVLAIIVAIAFACLYMSCHGEKFFEKGQKCNTNISAAAGCEWTIAFLLVVYLLMYCYDFWPARKNSATVAAEGWTTKKPTDSPFGRPFHNDSSYYIPQPSVDYRPLSSSTDKLSLAQSGPNTVSRFMPSPRAEAETKLDMESYYSSSPAAQYESPQSSFTPSFAPQGTRRGQPQQQYGRSPLSRSNW